MSTKPEGYAPDLFSEHARLAQLGSAVRARLLKLKADIEPEGTAVGSTIFLEHAALVDIIREARNLEEGIFS